MSSEQSPLEKKGAANGDRAMASVHGDNEPSEKRRAEPTTWLDSNWTWSDVSSWPLSVKFLPIVTALLVVFIGLYVRLAIQAYQMEYPPTW